MALVMASRVQKGAKSLWMNQQAYCTSWLGQNADPTMATAILDFHHQLETLTAGMVSGDKKEMLVPVETFVTSFSENSHEERLSLGVKQVKNPTKDKINELRDFMGKGHHSFERLAKGMGLDGDSVSDHGANRNARSSAPLDTSNKDEAQKAKELAAAIKMKEQAEKKGKPKKANIV